MSTPMIGIRYDMRRPSFAEATHAELYQACVAQCARADDLGFDLATLSEHHGVPDGYLPAPVTLAAAIAGGTRQIRIHIAALLLPLHEPIRLAEQIAIVDLLSGGRLSFIAGLGYRHEEFEMAGVDRTQRWAILEEYLDVLRRAWTGEPFTWRGRTVQVTPPPANPPLVMIGGSTEKAARRAARLRASFSPSIGDPALREAYEDECRKVGYSGGIAALPGGPGFVHVTEDPERDWAKIAPHALHDAQTYHAWQPRGQRSEVHVDAQTADDVRRSGIYRVVTPDECIALAREHGRIFLHPLMGGMPPEMGWASLELFAAKVLPVLRPASA